MSHTESQTPDPEASCAKKEMLSRAAGNIASVIDIPAWVVDIRGRRDGERDAGHESAGMFFVTPIIKFFGRKIMIATEIKTYFEKDGSPPTLK